MNAVVEADVQFETFTRTRYDLDNNLHVSACRTILTGGKGQAQAAVTLQRDWRNGQDPDSLPFARSIRSRSLVQLVHKGLLYYDTEQVVRQKQVRLYHLISNHAGGVHER